MNTKFKIFIVDDHELFRDGLKFVLSQSDKVEIVGEATNGKEFLEKLDNNPPDIILMDISMPEMNGIEATIKALSKYPDLKIIALTMFGDEEYYFKMIHAGVKGFVLKKSGKKDLEAAIEAVINGDSYFSNELLRNIIINLSDSKKNGVNNIDVKLTKRETEVLQLICKGYADNEIANQLCISPKTANGHRLKLLSKTGSKNSVNLVMHAIKQKWVEL